MFSIQTISKNFLVLDFLSSTHTPNPCVCGTQNFENNFRKNKSLKWSLHGFGSIFW